jgi:hypothetical protein
MFNGEALQATLPVNIALRYKNKELHNGIVIPSAEDIKIAPELSSVNGKKDIIEKMKKDWLAEFAAADKKATVNESKRNHRALKLFEKLKDTIDFRNKIKMSEVNTDQLAFHLSNKMVNPMSPTLMIWGAPGIGKTEIAHATLTEFEGAKMIYVDTVHMSPEEWFMPYLKHTEQQKKEGADPTFVDIPKGQLPLYKKTGDPEKDAEANAKVNGDGGGILFFDELSRASGPVLNSCLQLMSKDRRLGNFVLGSEWAVVAAGNRAQDTDLGIEFDPALANRFNNVNFTPSYEKWAEWAKNKGLNSAILDFLEFNHEDYWYTKTTSNENLVYASPRTWEAASNNYANFIKTRDVLFPNKKGSNLGYNYIKDAIESAVGPEVCDQFMAFLTITDKYPMEQIKKMWSNGDGPVPAKKGSSYDISEMNAIGVAGVRLVDGKTLSGQEFSNFCKWLVKLNHESTAAHLLRWLIDRHPYLEQDMGDNPDPNAKHLYAEGMKIHERQYGALQREK